MRAVQLQAYGGPESLQLVELPRPEPSPGEALVRVTACGVCGHDVLARRGTLGTPLPVVLGHEIAGVVENVADGAADVRVGDRVALVQRDPCGRCVWCERGATNQCRQGRGFYGEDQQGGYADYVISTGKNMVALPAAVSGSEAAILSCAVGTGLRALRRASAGPGDLVLVTGAGGGVGVHTVQLAKHLGATVLAVTGSRAKREPLREAGADHVIVRTDDDASLRDQVRDCTGGSLVDVVVDVAGPPTFRQAVDTLAPTGRLALVGNVVPQDVQLRTGLVIVKELSVVGSAHATRADLQEVVGMVADGAIRPVVSAAVPLEAAAQVHRDLDSRRVVGRHVLLT